MNEQKTPPRLKAVEALENYRIKLVWNNNQVSQVDLTEPIFTLKSLSVLQDRDFFKTVRLGEWGWSIVWSDEIDIGVESLYRRSQMSA